MNTINVFCIHSPIWWYVPHTAKSGLQTSLENTSFWKQLSYLEFLNTYENVSTDASNYDGNGEMSKRHFLYQFKFWAKPELMVSLNRWRQLHITYMYGNIRSQLKLIVVIYLSATEAKQYF